MKKVFLIFLFIPGICAAQQWSAAYITRAAADTRYLNVSSDTMTGPLIVRSSITANDFYGKGAALTGIITSTAAIVLSTGIIQTDVNTRVLRAGDTMTGALTISGSNLIVTGNAGIGTTNPVTKLQVGVGNTSADTAIAKCNTADTNVAALELSNWDGAPTTYGPRIHFDNSGVGTWYIGSSDGAHNFDIARTWGAPDLRINGSGNVGVGTTGPSTRLHVLGVESAINTATPGASAFAGLHLAFPTGINDNSIGLTFGGALAGVPANGSHAGIWVQSASGYGTRMYFSTTDSFAVGARTRMFINESGNIGVGTTAPATRLDISASLGDGLRLPAMTIAELQTTAPKAVGVMVLGPSPTYDTYIGTGTAVGQWRNQRGQVGPWN